ncbi:hypothetical protein N7489_011955 [Penicillium chrysogenum]|uniref:Uncharacterized protein n=1 Tax=Penicillium chrysogenum TaxID=5076 RepID=A0ABQ8W137_PENCH|nr:uncharacterized protein N7489_011955 [Penicillium chrysogenum]XP_061070650.1 uncharacterized protein N7525_006152 [Penicillium rubens]KAJ5231247.1 hypothetical protein N7489_011955 [Penicillium chrysogenum]KAJ5253573.1 hypothetical protein N7505_012236 [Penicillium chrysogenum]KAJ5260841.1 hypothetical protein N7524_008474 [Penicillium chrysogenum]KAJ5840964.1 hypothetical protein N7525_006152 [Penicillium rubens]KAJ5868951.1 hypothetical protein N7534_003504 [Penicillium rubens]
MRLQVICTLFMGTVIAIPYGLEDAQQPTTLSTFIPIKRATTTALTPPSHSFGAQGRMLPYGYQHLTF